jgi:hypothetical protein
VPIDIILPKIVKGKVTSGLAGLSPGETINSIYFVLKYLVLRARILYSSIMITGPFEKRRL